MPVLYMKIVENPVYRSHFHLSLQNSNFRQSGLEEYRKFD